jgi:Uncharacterised protein family (UPF0160)
MRAPLRCKHIATFDHPGIWGAQLIVCTPCSRDPEVWKDMDVLIDVGGEYEPSRHRYDHHQRGFDEVFGHGFSTKLSSAGLVYKHFGREIVGGARLQLHMLCARLPGADFPQVLLRSCWRRTARNA